MESFLARLQGMKERCAIQDAEYWDVNLWEGETPVECKESEICLEMEDGFIISMELEDGNFHVSVTLPKGFNHDELKLYNILDATQLFYCTSKHKYYWSYNLWGNANLFLPLEKQHRDSFVTGPVQILDTCRAFIQEMNFKKHKGPIDTFKKNLRWMKQQTIFKDDRYWDVKLEDGEIILSPNNDRTLRLQTKEGFLININIENLYVSCHLVGKIELPASLNFTSWIEKHAKFQALNCYVPYLELEVLHKSNSIYRWDHGNYQFNANLALSKASQEGKPVSGPVQVLKEARDIIRAVMMVESKLRMDKIREDLMMKACHPKRIAIWVEAGFDPFN